MSTATLLLDTNTLWNLELCGRLTEQFRERRLRVCIPTLVHAERIRQIAEQYGEKFAIDVVRQFIDDARFELLSFTAQDAERVADIWLELKLAGLTTDYWQAHRFDILLCAVARATGHTLITADTGQHFHTVSPRMDPSELPMWLQTGS